MLLLILKRGLLCNSTRNSATPYSDYNRRLAYTSISSTIIVEIVFHVFGRVSNRVNSENIIVEMHENMNESTIMFINRRLAVAFRLL